VGAKQRGDLSCERPPLLSDFSKTWFGFQITADVTSRLFGTYGRTRVSRTPSFLRCKSFLVPSRCSQLPECCVRLVSDSLASLFFVPLRGLVSDSLAGFFSGPSSKSRFRFPCEFLCRYSGSSLFGPLAGSASGAPMALVYSLLLEDRSSVELKDTPAGGDCKSVKRPIFVEIKGFLWKRTLSAGASSDRVRCGLWITLMVVNELLFARLRTRRRDSIRCGVG
jgi:hypothetical protein